MSNRVLLVVAAALILLMVLLLAGFLLSHKTDSALMEDTSFPSGVERQSEAIDRVARSERPTDPAGRAGARAQPGQSGLAKADPYLEASSIHDVNAQLLADGELSEAELAASMLYWIDVCVRSVGFVDRAGRQRPAIGLTGQAAESLHEFCGELATDATADINAYREAWGDAAAAVRNSFIDRANAEGVDAGLQAAVEAIFRSRNEIEIANALGTIILFGELESPFAGMDSASALHMFTGRVHQDAALALLCDNLGGCRGNHPLVSRHCLLIELHDGCYRPSDIYHAIEQTQTPIQHEVFWSLINQVRQMRRALQAERSGG